MANNFTINLNGKYQNIKTINNNYIENEIFYSEKLTPKLLSQVPMVLPNLNSYQLLNDRIILKTPIITGENVHESDDMTASTRIDVINKYLKIIKKFSTLPIFLQINLMRIENFYLTKGELLHRGVLIVEDAKFDYPFTNEHIVKTICFFVLKIINNDPSLINFENYFKKLENNNEKKNIDEIIEDIKKIYIKDLFVEKKFTTKPIKKRFMHPLRYINYNKVLSSSIFMIFIICSIIFIFKSTEIEIIEKPFVKVEEKIENSSYILIDKSYSSNKNGLIVHRKWQIYENNKLIKEDENDTLSFIPQKNNKYKVTLKVQDNNGNWSDEFNKDYSLQKILDKKNNNDIKNVKVSKNFYKKDGNSINITKSNNTFTINKIYTNKNINISFFLLTKNNNNINITIIGYSNNKIVFKNNSKLNTVANSWTKYKNNINSKKIDKLQFKFNYKEDELYLDELNITSTKNK